MNFLEQADNIFSILSEAISEGILVIDDKRTIVSTNSSLESMFEYQKQELLGKNLNILIPQNYHRGHDGHFEKYFSKSTKRRMAEGRNLAGIKKGGKEFPVEIGLNPFVIYGKKYIMALVMDISYRREAENEIRELNEQLEEKIKKRTKELSDSVHQLKEEVEKRVKAENKAKEALKKEKELNELKTKFLSLVSHEFKTPLSSILTSTILIGKYTEADQQEKREKHLITIKNKVHNLNNILNDFLSVERLDSGKERYKFTTFNLSKVFNEVIYDANMMLKAGQKINYPENTDDYVIRQDEKILELVLSNLIGNAIKYSPENTTVDIEIIEKNNGDRFVFKVKDEGIGIPLEDQKYIFSRYFRAQNAVITQGTGIGLNMVQGHLKNLGGNITFESIPGEGTTFTIEIPNQHKS